jgi:hypothetical protein
VKNTKGDMLAVIIVAAATPTVQVLRGQAEMESKGHAMPFTEHKVSQRAQDE